MIHTTEPVDRVIRTLNHQFREAIGSLQANRLSTEQRKYEIDFCYIVDNIQRDAICHQQRHISDAKKLIEEMNRRANGVK